MFTTLADNMNIARSLGQPVSIPSMETADMRQCTGNCNVRAGPSVSKIVTGLLLYGQWAEVLDHVGNWVKIGPNHWVNKSYLTEKGNWVNHIIT